MIEVCYGAIGSDDSKFHGYYIIKYYSYPNTIQSDWNIDVQLISSGEMVCEGTYYFSINTKNKSNNTQVSQREIFNINVNFICYYWDDNVPSYLISVTQKCFSSITLIHLPM